MEMTKKKPHGHKIGGSSKQKRRKENKGKSQISAKQIKKMTKHTISKEKILEAIRLLDKLQDDREGFSTDWTGIRISEIKEETTYPN